MFELKRGSDLRNAADLIWIYLLEHDLDFYTELSDLSRLQSALDKVHQTHPFHPYLAYQNVSIVL